LSGKVDFPKPELLLAHRERYRVGSVCLNDIRFKVVTFVQSSLPRIIVTLPWPKRKCHLLNGIISEKELVWFLCINSKSEAWISIFQADSFELLR